VALVCYHIETHDGHVGTTDHRKLKSMRMGGIEWYDVYAKIHVNRAISGYNVEGCQGTGEQHMLANSVPTEH